MTTAQEIDKKQLVQTIIKRAVIIIVMMTLLILVPAGTADFWQFYLYCASFIIPMCFALVHFLSKDPEFLTRRMKMREREREQKWIVGITGVIFVSGYILTGLDKRYSWSDVPVAAVIIADLFFIAGYLFILYVFSVNRFASRVVEVDTEQQVISTGPYGVVRHPMYSGLIVMYLATPVVLGSYWALLAFLLTPVSLLYRIRNEENVLRKDLPGYTDYCRTVRYRLIPYLW